MPACRAAGAPWPPGLHPGAGAKHLEFYASNCVRARRSRLARPKSRRLRSLPRLSWPSALLRICKSVQPHRHGAAYESRPRAAARRSGAAVVEAMARPANLEFDSQPAAAAIATTDRRTALRADRRRSRDCRSTTTPRRVLLALRAGDEARSDRVARRTGRDRRRVPHSRHHERAGAKLREVGTTNRTHLRDYARGDRRAHRAADEGPLQQLRDQGFTEAVPRARTRGARAERGLPVVGRSRQRHAGRSDAVGPAARDDRARDDRKRARTSSRSAATSCSAARRPG